MIKLKFVFLVIFFFFNYASAAVFAIGDIHGDINALKRILIGFQLIDQNSNWIGKDHSLVTIGDLVDRGPNVREVMDLLIKLEVQAQAQGGKVYNLLGNHEFLALKGIMDFSHMNDQYAFQEFKGGVRAPKVDGYKKAFQGETIYAKWFAQRPTIVIAEETLFVHAGLDEKSLAFSATDINQIVTNWVLYLQGKANKPDVATEWLIGSDGSGPLWTRKLSYEMDSIRKKVNPDMLPEEILDQILKHFNVKRIAMGHSLVTDFNNTVNHPVYGDKVISMDTGINEVDKHIVSGFKIEKGVVEGFWFDRYSQNIKLTVKSEPKSLSRCLKNYAR